LIRSHPSLPERARTKLLHANATRFFGLEAAHTSGKARGSLETRRRA
jgi:hypothetical protein